MSAHALLSASSSHRWLNCPPSARLCEGKPDTAGEAAAEGTDAHSLCEYKLKKALGFADIEDPTEDLTYYDNEMESCTEGYVAFVLELLERAKQSCSDPVVLIEQRLDFSDYVENGFGTGDLVIIADGTLYIVDFKYGKGVLVDAEDNPQMKLYALGALALADGIYDIDTVCMSIYQPRRDNVSSCTITKTELSEWAEKVLRPTAELAYKGEGEFRCGEWCGFCKAKATCRARAEKNLELAKYEFREPGELEDDEIEKILAQADELVSWANDIKAYALREALSGKVWSKFKLVSGTSRRKYADENLVAAAVQKAGYDPYERSVLGISDMTKMLGKKKFDELLGELIIKPAGKPVLVSREDKRPELNSTENAAMDFAEED
ncbi:MAG: DUF2800 domain-containing protein [Oscillospiraceae bacterium]|nr:DUF2800 domain-containing protein [Oscillospiraceae bacterium]